MEKDLSKIKNIKIAEPVVDVNDVCRITEGTRISGEIFSHSDIRVDGTIDGTMTSTGRIVIGENANIEGIVTSRELDLWGKIDGEIYSTELLTLRESSKVKGSVNVRKFQVEIGAEVNGTFKMLSESESNDLIAGDDLFVEPSDPEILTAE